MMKLLLIAIAWIIGVSAIAQRRTVYGYLQDSITHFAIVNGRIINNTTNTTVKPDEKGFFRMEVSPNDFIYAFADSYHYDTLNYSMMFSDTITIFLAPSGNVLPGVTVTSRYTKYQLDSMRRRDDFEQNRGPRRPAVSSANNLGFGIGINLDRVFKSKDKNAHQYEKRFPARERMAYVDYRFSPYIVAYYTGFKGEQLRNFMHRYMPTYEWLRKHPTNEDVLYYINDKLKAYRTEKLL